MMGEARRYAGRGKPPIEGDQAADEPLLTNLAIDAKLREDNPETR